MSSVIAQPAIRSQILQLFEDLPVEVILANGELVDIHYTFDWFRLLSTTTLEPGETLRIYRITPADGQSVLSIPCRYAVNSGSRRLNALANFYSPLFGPLDNAGVTVANMHSWARLLTSERWEMIDLRPLDVDAAFFHMALAALRQEGWWVDSYFCFGNWCLEVAGRSFAEYFTGRSSRVRNTINRAGRRLAKMPEFRLDIVANPGPALETAITDYQTVYKRSWKKPEPFPAFIPELCQLAADRGWLRLGLVRLAHRPVAAQLWLCDGRTTSIVKLAHDQSLAKLGAGSVLTAAMMQHALDVDRVQVVDYLIGDDAYKREWMSHRRERHGIIAFNPRTPGGIAGAMRHFGGRIWRRLITGPRLAPVSNH